MRLRKLYLSEDLFRIEAIFSLQIHILTQFSVQSFQKYVESGLPAWWHHLYIPFVGIAEILEGTVHGQARY